MSKAKVCDRCGRGTGKGRGLIRAEIAGRLIDVCNKCASVRNETAARTRSRVEAIEARAIKRFRR